MTVNGVKRKGKGAAIAGRMYARRRSYLRSVGEYPPVMYLSIDEELMRAGL